MVYEQAEANEGKYCQGRQSDHLEPSPKPSQSAKIASVYASRNRFNE